MLFLIQTNKYNLFVLFLCFFTTSILNAQNKEDQFNSGKLLLSQNKYLEAASVFEKMLKEDQNNRNLKFLLGQSYVQADTNLERAIELLQVASKSYTPDYEAGYDERDASEYVFFYLLKAYSLDGQCDSTLSTLVQLYKVYSYENEWYLVKGQELHRECMAKEVPEDTATVTPIEFEKEPLEVGTKSINYTDRTANYGVQVASMLEPVFTYNFLNLKNIEVYVDENGVYRYIIGSFLYKQQAEKLLASVHEKGYTDAFIVNTKDKTKFSEEVISINDESISKEITGKIDFRVQIGAYKSAEMPDELVDLYLSYDSIEVIPQVGYTVMTMGSFDSYEEADFYRELLKDLGINDAFVVAFNYNTKIDLKEAEYYLLNQKEAQEKAAEKEKSKKRGKKRKK